MRCGPGIVKTEVPLRSDHMAVSIWCDLCTTHQVVQVLVLVRRSTAWEIAEVFVFVCTNCILNGAGA
jgi:hypothetical protein